MIKVFILMMLSINFSYQKCLDMPVLQELGLKPLENSQLISEPEVCQNILKESKSCVDVDDLKEYLEAFRNYLNKKGEDDLKKFEEAEEKSKELVEELHSGDFELLTGNTITDEIQSKIDGIDPDDSEDLDIEAESKQCSEAQNKISLGSLCFLISDRADEFVLETDNFSGDKTKITDLVGDARFEFNLTKSLSLKVNENAADEVVKNCAATIRRGCVQKQNNQILDEIEGGPEGTEDEACLSAKCTEDNTCNLLAKSNMFQNKFTIKGNKIMDGEESEMSEKRIALEEKFKQMVEEKYSEEIAKLKELTENLKELKEKLDSNKEDEESKTEYNKLKPEHETLHKTLKTNVKALRKTFNETNKAAIDAMKELRKKKEEKEKKERPPMDEATKALKEKYSEELKAHKEAVTKLREELKLKVKAYKKELEADKESDSFTKEEKFEAFKKKLTDELELAVKAKEKELSDLMGVTEEEWKQKQKQRQDEKEKKDNERPKPTEGGAKPEGEKPAARFGLSGAETGSGTFSYVVDNAGADIIVEVETLGVSTSSKVITNAVIIFVAFITLF